MKTMRGEIMARLVALVILVLGMALGMKSSANEAESSEAICMTEIRKADIIIENSNSNDTIIFEAAKAAVSTCKSDFSEKQSSVYEFLGKRCQGAFSKVEGTTSEALEAYCQLNGIRFVMSLQLTRQR